MEDTQELSLKNIKLSGCVCVYGSSHTYVCICIYRPKIYVGCLSQSFVIYLFETGCLIEAHWLSRLSDQQVPWILLSYPSGTGITDTHSILTFTSYLGKQIKIPMLAQQAFYERHFPSPTTACHESEELMHGQ